MKWITSITILTLLILPSVYAIETTIKVTTEPNNYVMIRVFEAGSTHLLESILDKFTDPSGQVIVKHTSEVTNLDIIVYVRAQRNGETKYYQKFEAVAPGSTFEAYVPESLKPTTATEENKTNVDAPLQNESTNSTTEASARTSPSITGNAIFNAETFTKIPWYYIVTGAALAIVVVGGGIALKKRGRTSPATQPKTPPGSTKDPKELETKLEETQKRLEQATKEISRIKNEEQIKELQKNIDAQQEQIRKLQQGFA